MPGLLGPSTTVERTSKDGSAAFDAQLGDDGTPQNTSVTIDELFTNYIGEFGYHQMWLYSIVCLSWLPGALVTLNMAFFGKDPVKEHLWKCTDPHDVACLDAFNLDNPNESFCALGPAQWEWTHKTESVRSDLGMYCDRAWITEASNSVFFLGFLFGAAIWGIASDKYGRRRSLMLVIVLASIASASTSLAFNITAFILARFVSGLTVSGIGLVAFTLACEVVGASWRGVLGVAQQVFWCTGACLMPLVALMFPNWRIQTVVCAGCVLLMALLFPYIPESPRWLLSQGRTTESTAILKQIAQGNGKAMPRQRIALPSAPAGPSQATIFNTFKVPVLRSRMLILMFCWFVAAMAYYGVSLALDDLPGSLYLNFFFISFIEYPSYAASIALINRLGRRLVTVANYLCCGVACIACAAIPSAGEQPGSLSASLRISAAVAGKFGVAAAFALLFVYTTELFPTVVRNAALGANSAAARIGGVSAPLVVLLAHKMQAGALSFLIFGITSFAAGCLMLGLAETHGQPLPETIADVQRRAHGEYVQAADQVFVLDDMDDEEQVPLGEEM